MEDRRFGFIVVCVDDDDEGPKWHLATRQVFKTEGEATTYAGTVAESRTPIVVNGRWFEMRWADVALPHESIEETIRNIHEQREAFPETQEPT